MTTSRIRITLALGWLSVPLLVAAACPGDPDARDADVLLVARMPGRPAVALRAADLDALPPARLEQRMALSSGAGTPTERSVAYRGVLLRDVLARAGFGADRDRRARIGSVEAVATDGYRVVFSWGELFNAPAGEQILVIRARDDRALDATEGPLALRALGDLRPGPRHVRNLCALRVRDAAPDGATTSSGTAEPEAATRAPPLAAGG